MRQFADRGYKWEKETSNLPGRSVFLCVPDHQMFSAWRRASWAHQGSAWPPIAAYMLSHCNDCQLINVWLAIWGFASETSVLPLQPQTETPEHSQKVRLSSRCPHTVLETGSQPRSVDCLAQATGLQRQLGFCTYTLTLGSLRGAGREQNKKRLQKLQLMYRLKINTNMRS